jgi:hypothetical protein
MADGSKVMQLLAAGVPLTLLLDVLSPPDAAEVYSREGRRDPVPQRRGRFA